MVRCGTACLHQRGAAASIFSMVQPRTSARRQHMASNGFSTRHGGIVFLAEDSPAFHAERQDLQIVQLFRRKMLPADRDDAVGAAQAG